MHTDCNLESHLAALLFFAGGAGFLLLLLSAMGAAFLRKERIMRLALLTIAAGIACYLLLLLAFSGFSQQHMLAVGAEKHLCELDCHLAYSVTSVEQKSTLGEGTKAVSAQGAGVFYVVRMRVRFDETTISPQRPRGARLSPSPHRAILGDGLGHEMEPSVAGQQALGISAETAPLLPGESAEIAQVFEIPWGHPDRMLFTQNDTALHWVIGNENSLGHQKTWFQLWH